MNTLVSIGPVVEFLKPAIQDVAAVVILAGLGAVGNLARKYLKIQISSSQMDLVRKAMADEVHRMVGEGVDKLSTINVNVESPQVARVANAAIANAGPVVAKLGITPDEVKALALSTIGAYQASVESNPAPVVVSPAPIAAPPAAAGLVTT
ncbi:MAG: hypothetical protein WDN46_14430 [Methylocella sp.]